MFDDRPPSDPAQWQDFDQLLSQYQRAQRTRSSYRYWLFGTLVAVGLGLGGWELIHWLNAPRFTNLPPKIASLPLHVFNPENPLQNDQFSSQVQVVPLPERKPSFALSTENSSPKTNANASASEAAVSQFEEARPVGGYPALYEYFAKHLQYPEAAKIAGVTGSVLVEFYINEAGYPDQIRILQGIREDINEEAIRLVKSMPQWSSARVNGEPVATKHTMPLNFQLGDNF